MATSTEIRTTIRVLEAFKAVDPEISLPAMLAFLYYVERDGQSGNQSYVNDRLAMSEATTSRSTSHWLEWKRPRVRGHAMLESVPDPGDRRYRIITLTRKGLDFADKIRRAFHGT